MGAKEFFLILEEQRTVCRGWREQRGRRKEISGQPILEVKAGCAGSRGSELCGLVGRVVGLGRCPAVQKGLLCPCRGGLHPRGGHACHVALQRHMARLNGMVLMGPRL